MAARRAVLRLATVGLAIALQPAGRAVGQAGPPFLTNDPGTPGNANWEINLATADTVQRSSASIQAPQIDLNYGLGERVQLTFEVPYVFDSGGGQPQRAGWSNAQPGIKWRFVDQGNQGWHASVFPQVETRVSTAAEERGIAGAGPRVLLPLEVSKSLGAIDVDVEAGYYLPRHGVRERIFGLVVGHAVTERLEFDAEWYDDRASGAATDYTSIDVGGRYALSPSFILLLMAGRGVSGTAGSEPRFISYLGIQILLKDYGRSLGGRE